MKTSCKVLAVLFFLPFNAAATTAAYSFTYGADVYHFETLAEAENAFDTLSPDARYLEQKSRTVSVGGRAVITYQVPETFPPTALGLTSFGCVVTCRYSLQPIIEAYREKWSNGGRNCIISGPAFSGSWIFQAWNNYTWGSSAPPDGDIHTIWYGEIVGTTASNYHGECEGEPYDRTEGVHRYDAYDCPDGYQVNQGLADLSQSPCYSHLTIIVRGTMPQTCDETSGNPCGILTGNKREDERDYSSKDLEFERNYNSALLRSDGNALGSGWHHSYQREIVLSPSGSPEFYVDAQGILWRALGIGTETHKLVGKDGAVLMWNALDQTWMLKDGERREIFNANGRLERIVKNNRATILSYDAETGLLGTVTAPSGRQLLFEYQEGRLTAVTRPDGERIVYEYAETEPVVNSDEPRWRLVSVGYPDGTSRTYHYERDDLPYHLTGITDENGERFSTFTYDSAGQVTGSEHAGGVEKVSIDRRSDGTTVVTDPHGQQSTYRYSAVHNYRKLASVEGGPCATCSNSDQGRTYDGNGNVKTRTGFDGVVTEYQRDSYGREISRTEAVGTAEQRVITTEWDTALSLPTRITEPGRISEYTYDADGNRLTETVTDTQTGESRTTTWTYGSDGHVLTIDGARSDVDDVTSYTYDAYGNLATTTNALDHITQYTDYDPNGNPLEIIDPNGTVTRLTYDLRQRLTSRTVAYGTPEAVTTTFEYDPVGQLVRTTLPDGSWIGYEYDAAHRMTAIEDSAGNRIDYTLDVMGNRIEERVTGTDGLVIRETFREYNQLNRLVTESGPEGSRMDYTYDAEGKRTAATDVHGNTTTSRYDTLDRLFETVDALNGVTSYAYDPRDNLTQVVDPRGVTTDYVYNGFNELIEIRSPDAGTTTYTYDKAGNRISQTDARGVTAIFSYDALSRLTFIDYPGTAKDITYEYDALPNAIGRLVAIEDETGRTEYAYDARGNLVSKATEVNDTWLPVTYDHDAADRFKELVYPDNLHVIYDRDAHGRVTGIDLVNPDGSRTSIASDIQYVAFGGVRDLIFGNGISEARSFDLEGRLINIASGPAVNRSYSWDASGNITAINNLDDPGHSQSFTYDALYRLTYASGGYGNLTYQYDAVGNRTHETFVPPNTEPQQSTSYTYALDSNRLIEVANTNGDTTYTYDANGNTLSDGTNSFVYDDRNRLVAANGMNHYAHNALGQRVYKHTPASGGGGALDPDTQAEIDHLEADAQAALDQAQLEQQAADQAFATAAPHQQQADAYTAEAEQNWLEAQQNRAAYEENLADIAEAEAEIAELQQDIADLQAQLIDPAETPEDEAHNAPLLAQIAEAQAEIEEEQLDIEDDTADAEEDLADALDDEADAEEAEADAAESQALANQFTQQGNAHLATAQALEQQATDLQAQADALRDAATQPQGGTVLFAYDETGHLLGEYDETGNPIRQYVWLGDQPVAMITPDSTAMNGYAAYYIHVNNIDAPQVVTDQNGQVVWRADYRPFGEAEEAVLNIEFNLRLPGQYRDQESGLHYNYFRSYDPDTGRYGQNDPIGLSGGLNRYAYVKANPISRFDQYGLFDAVNPADYPNLDPGDGGVFCDGRGGFRVWVPNDWDECIRDCVVQHENMHLNHIYTKNQQSICSGKTADHRIVASTQEERLWTERIAYQTEKRCLQNKLAAIECGDACESRIRNRILFVDGKLNQEDF